LLTNERMYHDIEMEKDLSIKVEIFKEDDLYVALAQELNVSSFGETFDEAKESIKEAIELFLEACREMGTLNEISKKSIANNIEK